MGLHEREGPSRARIHPAARSAEGGPMSATVQVGRRVLLPLAGVLLVLAAWQATVVAYALPAIVLPSPVAVLQALAELVRTRACWPDVGVSLGEFLAGFVVGGMSGVAVGLLIGESRRFRLSATPVV